MQRFFTWPLEDRARGLILLVVLALCLTGVFILGKTLVPFYIAFTLVYLLNPVVSYLAGTKVKGRLLGRLPAIILVYIIFVLVIWFSSLYVLPKFYHEFARLAQILPKQFLHFERTVLPEWVIAWQGYLDTYNVPFDIKHALQEGVTGFLDTVKGEAMEVAKRTKDLIASFFSAILTGVLVFMLTSFLLYDLPRLQAWLSRLIPDTYRVGTMALVRDIDKGLAGAVRGQLGVCVVNSILTTIGLMALGVKFAITLGFVAGVFSLIPVFGTLFSTIPIVAVALTKSLMVGVLALVWILVIHLIEANLLNPNIVGYNAELHPALVVLALLIGEHYGGGPGLLVAVPIATVIRAILTYTVGRLIIPPLPPEGGSPRELLETHNVLEVHLQEPEPPHAPISPPA